MGLNRNRGSAINRIRSESFAKMLLMPEKPPEIMPVFKLVTMCLWGVTERIFANRFSEETAKSFANNF